MEGVEVIPSKTVQPSESLSCSKCSQTQATKPKLSFHYLYKHHHCPTCALDFSDKNETLNHLNQKHGKRIKCDYGACAFIGFEFELKAHLKTKHRQGDKMMTFNLQYKCKICPGVLHYERDLVQHYAMEHTYCYFCKTQFREKLSICDHMIQKHNVAVKQVIRCKFCHLEQSTQQILEAHYQSNHFYCPLCDETLENSEELTKHNASKSHLDAIKKSYKCDLCDFRSENKTLLDAHLRNEHKTVVEDRAKCLLCNVVRCYEDEMKKHYFYDHKYCPDCKLYFYNTSAMVNHCETVHKMKVACDKCDYRGFEWTLEGHLRSHASQQEYAVNRQLLSQQPVVLPQRPVNPVVIQPSMPQIIIQPQPMNIFMEKCSFCQQPKFSRIELKKHYYIEHNHCMDCKRTYQSYEVCLNHARHVHKMKVNCDECPYINFEWFLGPHKAAEHENSLPKITSVVGNVKLIGEGVGGDGNSAPPGVPETPPGVPERCKFCYRKNVFGPPYLKRHYLTNHRYCMDCDMSVDNLGNDLVSHMNTKHGMQINCPDCEYTGFDWMVEIHRKSCKKRPPPEPVKKKTRLEENKAQQFKPILPKPPQVQILPKPSNKKGSSVVILEPRKTDANAQNSPNLQGTNERPQLKIIKIPPQKFKPNVSRSNVVQGPFNKSSPTIVSIAVPSKSSEDRRATTTTTITVNVDPKPLPQLEPIPAVTVPMVIKSEPKMNQNRLEPIPVVSLPMVIKSEPKTYLKNSEPTQAVSIPMEVKSEPKTYLKREAPPPSYKCTVCMEIVASEEDLEKHNEHFNCHECDFVTISSDVLEEHMNESHSILPD